MNDTDKYEGHTPAPWRISDCGHGYIDAQNWIGSEETGDGWVQSVAKVSQEDGEQNLVHSNVDTWNANAQLIADAPLLLAEVKRLRERLDLAERYIINPYLRNYFADVVSKGLDDERDNLG
tara:strand:- start:766 stop:1128 length:363 start_codon:yes stop_codon:yes gene_type:complete